MAEGSGTGGGAGVKALAVVQRARVKYGALPARKRNWLTAVLTGIAVVVLASAWYAGRPDWRVLFSGLEGRDVQQVSQELSAAGIAFQTTPDGVEVPAELLDKARMEVAAKGMPQSGRLGFELFDKPNWVGSEFDERVNYQRALEGELEHTIGTLGAVRSARVHLVLPQDSLFATEAKVAKASVVMKLKHVGMGAEEADSIRNLVAGAVENLQPEQVTLVDADGRTNLQGKGRGVSESDAAQAMEARLIAMLEPLAGVGNVRATVNVSYDQGSEERMDETYDPAGSVALSSAKSEQVSANGAGHAQGVPGTASNTPAAAAVGAVQGSAQAAAPGTPPLLERSGLPVYPTAGGQNQTKKEESGTYAVSKHTVHRASGPGQVRRVTAAVVVNDKAAGAGVWKPRSMEEMHRLEGLAKAAVGFDEKRGDEVVMENVGFSSNVPEVKAAGAAAVVEQAKSLVASQPGLLKTMMLGVVGMMLVFFVLRPVAGQVVTTLREPALLSETVSQEARGLAAGVLTEETAELPGAKPVPAAPKLRMKASAGAAVYDQVSEHIKREPGQSTRLLEAWISADEEAG